METLQQAPAQVVWRVDLPGQKISSHALMSPDGASLFFAVAETE